jgi:hypothetical protein
VITAREKQFEHLTAAKEQLVGWAGANAVPLVHVDFVVPFAETDFSVTVWLFYDTNVSLSRLDGDGGTARVQEEFLSILRADGYPDWWLSDVSFSAESHENIERDFEGSYLHRLR